MVAVMITREAAVFEVLGWHKFLAAKSRIVVPLANLRGVRADPNVNIGWRQGWRIPGTHIPGLIVAGTFYQRGRRIFRDVVHPEGAIIIDLVKHRYDQLVVEVPDPTSAVERLDEAMRGG